MFKSAVSRVFIGNDGPQLVFHARIHTVFCDGYVTATLPDGPDWHTPQKLYIVFQDCASPDQFFDRQRPGVLIVANDFMAAGLDTAIPVYTCVFRSYRVYTGHEPAYEPVCEKVRRALRKSEHPPA